MTTKNWLRYGAPVFLLLALLCIVPASLMAQTMGGSIDGTVTDPNGAVVPSAMVTATK